MEESQLDIIEIKEAIHDIKLKDAITRQELMRSEREGANLKEKILKTQKEIAKLEKDLKKDQKLLESQEDNIVTANLEIMNRKKIRKNDCNLIQESIDRQNHIVKEIKRRHDELMNFLSSIRKKSNYLDIALKDNKNSNDAMIKMREFINLYEEFLGNIE